MSRAPQTLYSRPAPRPSHHHPSAAAARLIVGPVLLLLVFQWRRSSRGFVVAFRGTAYIIISRPGPRSPSSRASGRLVLLSRHVAARVVFFFCASVASSCWPGLALRLLPGGCAASCKPFLLQSRVQRLLRGDECDSSKPLSRCGSQRASSFVSKLEGGLAACKTLASKQGRFSFLVAAQSAHSSPQEDQEFHRSSSQNIACLSGPQP